MQLKALLHPSLVPRDSNEIPRRLAHLKFVVISHSTFQPLTSTVGWEAPNS
jgi:hypothetical protein